MVHTVRRKNEWTELPVVDCTILDIHLFLERLQETSLIRSARRCRDVAVTKKPMHVKLSNCVVKQVKDNMAK